MRNNRKIIVERIIETVKERRSELTVDKTVDKKEARSEEVVATLALQTVVTERRPINLPPVPPPGPPVPPTLFPWTNIS